MALVYKRDDSPIWYVTTTRKSTRTTNRKLAEEYAKKSLETHWRGKVLGHVKRTWVELVTDWLDVKSEASSLDQDRMVIARFGALLASKRITLLEEVTGDVVAEYARSVKEESTAATANRHLTTIRAMLRRAAAKEPPWIPRAPTIAEYKIVKKEVRWVTIAEFNTILPHLPEWVADMAVFAVQTGMRYSNVAGMRWDWISADGNIAVVPAVHTKTERTYTVPLSSVAKTLVSRLREKQSGPYVFTRPGVEGPIPSIRFWWEEAREKAGFPKLRWHDLRHTWASLHAQNETPDRILAQMGGWASTRMLQTYAHLSTKHLEAYADNLNNG